MTIPDYNSPAALKALLDANGFSMQKKFGQNFLVNASARERIVRALEIERGMEKVLQENAQMLMNTELILMG